MNIVQCIQKPTNSTKQKLYHIIISADNVASKALIVCCTAWFLPTHIDLDNMIQDPPMINNPHGYMWFPTRVRQMDVYFREKATCTSRRQWRLYSHEQFGYSATKSLWFAMLIVGMSIKIITMSGKWATHRQYFMRPGDPETDGGTASEAGPLRLAGFSTTDAPIAVAACRSANLDQWKFMHSWT